MSADNGIYVLRTPAADGRGFEFRVAHAQAIDNIDYPNRGLVDEYLLNVFGRSWVLHRQRRAVALAHLLHDDMIADGWYTEYGVQVVELERPFPGTSGQQL